MVAVVSVVTIVKADDTASLFDANLPVDGETVARDTR
jgi:hypothetical protein